MDGRLVSELHKEKSKCMARIVCKRLILHVVIL
jgi:hypothetical protein